MASNLRTELEKFAVEVNHLKDTYGIPVKEGINLLMLTLNYNITLRQMGLAQPAPAPEEPEDGEG